MQSYINNIEIDSLELLPSYYIYKISEPIHNTCHNITCNWFTLMLLDDNMFEFFSPNRFFTTK